MVEGAKRTMAHASLVLVVTGIAGPSGSTAEKPVGLVHIAATGKEILHERLEFSGNRDEIRLTTVAAVLDLGLKTLGNSG